MTAIPDTQGQGLPRWLWLLLALIVIPGPLFAVIDTPNGRVMTTSHAVERHGDEAEQIRCQIRRGNILEIFENEKDPCIQYWLTQLECGRFAIMISQLWPSLVDGCDWRERSSYVVRDGSYDNAIDYLLKFAHRIK